MKVTVVGAGNVGATCADVIAQKDFVHEVVLLDIKEGTAEGKSLDIWQTAAINLYDTRTVGSTNDYSKTANSDVVVITSGLPRKPGMSRDDLIATNAGIVRSVTENIIKHSPNGFKNTELLEYLNSLNINDLVICGMMTHMCVDATTRAAKDYGFNGILIGDACATKDLEINGIVVKAEYVQNSFLAALNYFYSSVKTTNQYLNQTNINSENPA